MRWAMLLKGVNVGGNNRLPMANLRALLGAIGFGHVRSLLASGNAVFECDENDRTALEALLEREIAARVGLKTDILVRDSAAIAAVLAANPFPDAPNPSQLLVLFHRDPVPPPLVAMLIANHVGPERIAAVDRELFIDFAGTQRDSTVTTEMAKQKFPKVATGRNLNTVTKLAAMLVD